MRSPLALLVALAPIAAFLAWLVSRLAESESTTTPQVALAANEASGVASVTERELRVVDFGG